MENYGSDAGSSAVIAALVLACLIPCLIVYVITVIGMWKIFEKAGKPGWAAIIPVYNHIVMLEIVGKPIWWIFLILFPCTSLIFGIWTLNLISKSFGQSEGFTIGLVLLPFIFYPVLGFGSYQYLGPSASEAGGLKPNNPFNSTNYQDPFNNPPQA
jgi:ABC-type sulfate transport system permease subunit